MDESGGHRESAAGSLGLGKAQQLVPDDVVGDTELTLEIVECSAVGVELDDDVVAVLLLVDGVGELTPAPPIGLSMNAATGSDHGVGDGLDPSLSHGLVEVTIKNDHEFVRTHQRVILPSDSGVSRGPFPGQGQYDPRSVAANFTGAAIPNNHVRSVAKGCDGVSATVRPMDLMQWIRTDLTSVRAKLTDAVVALVPHDRWHERADGGGTTIAGLLLHIARHQDLAVNAVARGREPLFPVHRLQLGLGGVHTGAALSEAEDRPITSQVGPADLLVYVDAVFDTTASWLDTLSVTDLDHVPDTADHLTRLGHLSDTDYPWLYRMWGGQSVGWLLQWPVVGHANAHVGEGISIRNRMGLSPF